MSDTIRVTLDDTITVELNVRDRKIILQGLRLYQQLMIVANEAHAKEKMKGIEQLVRKVFPEMKADE
jgi:hypothetical protein